MPEQTEQSKDLWTQVLDLLAKVITPDWSDVIAWLPLMLVALLVLTLAFVAFVWLRNVGYNRARVPRRVALTPPGIHMPGPSRWPFVVPVGATLILYGLAIRPTDSAGHATAPVNLPVLTAGLVVTAIALVGWLRDAMREWRRAEGLPEQSDVLAMSPGVAAAGALGPGLRVSAFPARPAVAVRAGVPVSGRAVAAERVAGEPPPGVHLPGPSPWPFLFPLALSVVFFGLVFSPAIILGGVLMVVIAAVGWLRDAGYEFRQVEAGHHPEPRTRDPERAFPKRLLGVYALIGLLSVALIVAPRIIAFANQSTPSGAPGASPGAPGGAPAGQIAIVADQLKFNVKDLQVPAGKPFTMTFENKDTVPHNVAIYTNAQLTTPLFQGEIFSGPKTVTYNVTPIPAGQHYFVCNVHPNMNGTVTAK
jgi:plastocyanin